MSRLLLHACCAPCSAAIVEWLLANAYEPTVFFCNPNIYPREEYEIRKAECTRFCTALGLQIVDADYDHEAWCRGVAGLEHEPERGRRCEQCFYLRLRTTAEYAHAHGFPLIATTLASSRWKDVEQVNRAGLRAVEDLPDVQFWARNWRKGGLQERRAALLRQYAFYNQTYCGCEYSHR